MDSEGAATISSIDPGFRFVIEGDILGYGAPVKDGYLGRFSGRGLFDVELQAGKTTLMYDAAVKVDSFSVMPGAALLGTAHFDKNQHSTIQAKNFDLWKGSLVDIDRSFLFGNSQLTLGNEYTIIELDHTGLPLATKFANESQAWDDCQRVSVRVNDYWAELYWKDDESLVMKVVSGPALNDEHSGSQAMDASAQASAISTGLSQGSIMTRIDSRVTLAPSRQAPPSSGEFGERSWSVWLSPWYSYGRHKSQSGLSAFTVKTPGLTLGVDRLFRDGTAILGLAVSLARPEAKGDFIDLKAKAFSIAGYSSLSLPGNFDLSGIIGYGVYNYDQIRRSNGDSYFADYRGNSFMAALSLGRVFNLNESWSTRPYARLDFLDNTVNAYSERGAGIQAQAISKQKNEQWRTEIGADVNWESAGGVKISGRIGWSHNLSSGNNSVSGHFHADQPDPAPFRFSTSPFDRNSAVFGVTASIPLSGSVDLNFHYDGSKGRRNSSHAGALILDCKF
jgi:outer membrane autotransporter protein